MCNYIKSECFRLIHNKISYVFIAICTLLLLSSNCVLAAVRLSQPDFPYASTKFAVSMLCSSFATVYLLCICVGSFIFGNEYMHHTMKNCVSYGISRGTLFFGKLIMEIVYALVSFTVIIAVYVGSSYLLLSHTGLQDMITVVDTTLACLPHFLFALAATNTFSFLIEGTGGVVGAACGLMLGFPLVCNLLGQKFLVFEKIASILPWNMISKTNGGLLKGNTEQVFAQYLKTGVLLHDCVAAIVQIAMIIVIGYIVFQKKEIK